MYCLKCMVSIEPFLDNNKDYNKSTMLKYVEPCLDNNKED